MENNPIRYIDPFGLDKEDREKRRQKRRERRRKRRENRERKKYVDPEKREYYIPEVAVYASKPKPKAGPLVALIWNVEQLIRGNHNPTKTRKATRFEEWAIKHFDMSEILRLADILGDGRGEGTNNNKVETDAYYEGPTSDEKINESASNNNELIKNEVDKRKALYEDRYSHWHVEPKFEDAIESPNEDSIIIDAHGSKPTLIYKRKGIDLHGTRRGKLKLYDE